MIHETITQNLLTLLRAGAFQQTEGVSILAMSPHKWRTLQTVATTMNVMPYVTWGAHLLKDDTHLHPMMQGNEMSARDFDTSSAQMYNIFTQKKLDAVREEEMNSGDISEETLLLLDILVRNADDIIVHDITMEGIIALGVYIRDHKDTIDWEKLTSWLSRIGLVQVSSLQACMLLDVFQFSEEELPFLVKQKKNAGKLLLRTVSKALEKHSFSMRKRMDVAMLETLSHRFVSAVSLVTDIEE